MRTDEVDVDQSEEGAVWGNKDQGGSDGNLDSDRNQGPGTSEKDVIVVGAGRVITIVVKQREELGAHNGVFKLGETGGALGVVEEGRLRERSVDHGGVNDNIVAVLIDEFVKDKRHGDILCRDIGCSALRRVLSDHGVREYLASESE